MIRVSTARGSCGRSAISPNGPKGKTKTLSMNQLVILSCAMFALATAAPLIEHVESHGAYSTPIPILRHSVDGPNPDGSYNYNYETANGIQAEELGYLNYAGTQAEAREAQGRYTYTAPNGEVVQVSYVANENGFQPQGSHIPPVPPHIVRALEYIAAHPEENENNAH